MSVGYGHKGLDKLPAPQEITQTARFQKIQALALIAPGSRGYLLGQCLVIVSPPYNGDGWHMSISHTTRYPSWDEVAKARYDLIPNEAHMVMHLPPKEDYVNIHEHCFQLKELVEVQP